MSLESKIRLITNSDDHKFYTYYFKNNSAKWNQFCAALDVIGDSELAINEFILNGTGSGRLGKKYLNLYGIFQATYIQQDAIETLYKIVKHSFKNNKLKVFEKYKGKNWDELRNYRNLTVGHPTKCETFEKGKTKNTFIVRSTLGSGGSFQILICDDKQKVFKYVDIKNLIACYLLDVEYIIADIEISLNFIKESL